MPRKLKRPEVGYRPEIVAQKLRVSLRDLRRHDLHRTLSHRELAALQASPPPWVLAARRERQQELAGRSRAREAKHEVTEVDLRLSEEPLAEELEDHLA